MGNASSQQELQIAPKNVVQTEEEILALYSLGRLSFDDVQNDLISKFPSLLSHPKKKLVYDLACPTGAIHRGSIVCNRLRAIPLPHTFPFPGSASPLFEMQENVFQYTPNTAPDTVVEWYVNFADTQLFVAYGGSLFAQDEIQVAEHPSLGHLKEALRAKAQLFGEGCLPVTRQADKPTPILIKGVERRCSVAVNANAKEGRPVGLYGNAFARGTDDAITKATTVLDPPTTTNFIAMAALGGGHGEYTKQQVVDLLTTAYTSFLGARIESNLAVNGGKPGDKKANVVIHTGNWGTGAFGGNKPIMAIVQCAAAWMAGVDKVVYHTFNREGTEGYKKGKSILDEQFSTTPVDTEQFIDKLVEAGFRWGVSDGN